jgi:hypothetical protein
LIADDLNIEMIYFVEDVGGCLQKLYTELLRDWKAKQKKDYKASTCPLASFTLDGEVPSGIASGWLASRYGDRHGFRKWWKSAWYDLIHTCTSEVAQKLKGHNVRFCGIGHTEEQQKQVFEIRSDNPGNCIAIESLESDNREDTNLVGMAMHETSNQRNALIWVEDGDLPQIAILNLSEYLCTRMHDQIGTIFIRFSAQSVQIEDKSYFDEQFINCNELGMSIINHPGLQHLNQDLRIPTIVVLMIILGGDTTSYIYMPYEKALAWYLEHADFVGALVRNVSEDERSQGFDMWGIDEDAVTRLIIMLYARRNPATVIPLWTKYTHDEQTSILKGLTYLQVCQVVAHEHLPKIFRYVMSMDNLKEHLKRTMSRLHCWSHASRLKVPDVPQLGFEYKFHNKDIALPEVFKKAPTYANVAQLRDDGYEVVMVQPTIHEVNITHVELFGKNGLSPQEVVRGAQKAAEKQARGSISAAQLRYLTDAKQNISNDKDLTVAQMKAVVIAYQVQAEDYTLETLTELKAKMNPPRKSVVKPLYDNLIRKLTSSADGSTMPLALPWNEMGLKDSAELEQEQERVQLLQAEEEEEEEPEQQEDRDLREHAKSSTSVDNEDDMDEELEENEALRYMLEQQRHQHPEDTDQAMETICDQEFSDANDMGSNLGEMLD